MKKVNITIKNSYTKKIEKAFTQETYSKTYKDLIKELNLKLQDVLIYNEEIKSFISESNIIEKNTNIILFNTDGQVI